MPLLPRVTEKKYEAIVLTSAPGSSVIKKNYSKTLWLPIVAIIFKILLYARHCARYLTNIPHNSLKSMYYLVNAAGEEWNLASNSLV